MQHTSILNYVLQVYEFQILGTMTGDWTDYNKLVIKKNHIKKFKNSSAPSNLQFTEFTQFTEYKTDKIVKVTKMIFILEFLTD